MKPVVGVLDAATNITADIANTPYALMQKQVISVTRRRLPRILSNHEKLGEYKKKKVLASLIVWHMEQLGLDGRQLYDLSNAQVINKNVTKKVKAAFKKTTRLYSLHMHITALLDAGGAAKCKDHGSIAQGPARAGAALQVRVPGGRTIVE